MVTLSSVIENVFGIAGRSLITGAGGLSSAGMAPATWALAYSAPMTGDAVGVVAATTLASGVEFVEALTIVLAMGTTRGWRSTWAGVGAALVSLAVITALAGYAIQSWLPEALLQLVVGTLLLIFGLQWLRKAILRSAGLKALHDEEDAFRSEVQAAREAGDERRLGLDWFAFVVSFKGVFLEGLEIVFIVITFGLNADSIWLAVLGAAIGGTIVLAAGVALHKPLARVPENTIKFVVGLLLSTFGTFWAVEGLGWFAPDDASLHWPGGDLALPILLALWCALALAPLAARSRGRLSALPLRFRALLVGLRRRRRLAHRRGRRRRAGRRGAARGGHRGARRAGRHAHGRGHPARRDRQHRGRRTAEGVIDRQQRRGPQPRARARRDALTRTVARATVTMRA
jgi:uncharacterized membrane protein